MKDYHFFGTLPKCKWLWWGGGGKRGSWSVFKVPEVSLFVIYRKNGVKTLFQHIADNCNYDNPHHYHHLLNHHVFCQSPVRCHHNTDDNDNDNCNNDNHHHHHHLLNHHVFCQSRVRCHWQPFRRCGCEEEGAASLEELSFLSLSLRSSSSSSSLS